MPLILAVLVIAALSAFVQTYWVSILTVGGAVLSIMMASMASYRTYTSRRTRREARRKQEAALAACAHLRDEPLSIGESLDDRVYSRYITLMRPFFSEIGTLRSQKPHLADWRLRIETLASIHVRPTLSDEQYAHLLKTLDYNGRQNLISKYEEPVLPYAVARDERLLNQQALKQSLLNKSHRSPQMTPLGFETWCRDKLQSQGWTAEITKASGDQGADIVAQRSGQKVVVQCKFYTGSVGNRAVQEVSAARHFYGAGYAAV